MNGLYWEVAPDKRDEPRRLQARDVSFERRFKSQGQQFEDLERSGFWLLQIRVNSD